MVCKQVLPGRGFAVKIVCARRFEHLVGELMIAAAAKSGGDLNPGQMKKLQVSNSLCKIRSPGWHQQRLHSCMPFFVPRRQGLHAHGGEAR